MEYLLTGTEMSACDVRTSDPAVIGIPSLVLMERAALSIADGAEAYLKNKYGCPDAPGRQGTAPAEGRARPMRISGSCGREPVPAEGRARPARRSASCRQGTVLAVAGRGNNGADALAAGRILIDRGYQVRFCRLPGAVAPDSSFAVQENILRNYGASVEVFYKKEFVESSPAGPLFPDTGAPDVILDGLFGTGLSRPLQGEAAACVEWINGMRAQHGAYVVAVDIPSGISSDDGQVMGCAVRCNETRTFAFYKRGHFMYPGASYAGAVHLAQIGITERAFSQRPGMFTFLHERPAQLLPPRDPGGNKGTFGKVLIVAGRRNMCGAALLAASACMAAGAGMVKVFTHEANRVIVQQSLPEALLDTFSEEDTPEEAAGRLRASLEWADIAAAGPAMGTDALAATLLRGLLAYAAGFGNGRSRLRGLVLDADAIRILADRPDLCGLLAGRPEGLPCILTPHLAEFSALAGQSIQHCKENRIQLVRAQADRLRSTIICKDARTLAAAPSAEPDSEAPLFLNCTGNSGMATAGSGDVLTGMTAAILGLFTAEDAGDGGGKCGILQEEASVPILRERPLDPILQEHMAGNGFAAACSAVCIHGMAGDAAAARLGETAMKAGDLVESLRQADFWK